MVKSIRGVVGFVRVVEAGSFAGAAKKLGITPVAVSKNVQRLERELGVRLLQRSTRKLSLTQEGRAYYERCTGPLRELENAEAAITEKGKSPTGALRVTCLSPFGRTYVLPLIPAFSRLYPGIELELHLDDAIDVAKASPFPDGLIQHPSGNEQRTLVDGPHFTLVLTSEVFVGNCSPGHLF